MQGCEALLLHSTPAPSSGAEQTGRRAKDLHCIKDTSKRSGPAPVKHDGALSSKSRQAFSGVTVPGKAVAETWPYLAC